MVLEMENWGCGVEMPAPVLSTTHESVCEYRLNCSELSTDSLTVHAS